jgi:hypothetical protein
LANYNPDHPFFFSGKGSGNANVTNAIDLFDLHFCYDNRVSERIEREYGIRTALLPFAFELSSELCEKLNNLEEIKAACFIGTCDDIRVEHVFELAKTGVPIHVYGNNWDQAVPEGETSITAFPAVYNEEFWEKMRAYRLQLNIFRPHNIGSHNMRTFEVPAVGGIMLAPDIPDHHLFFEPRKEIFLYRNKTEMITKAQEIMALSETEALQIRNAARARSLASKYTYEHRAMAAFQAFQQMMELV